MVDEIEMPGVFSAAATDVLALYATDVFSADTTDVLSAAKAADGGFCPANNPCAAGWAIDKALHRHARDLSKTWFCD